MVLAQEPQQADKHKADSPILKERKHPTWEEGRSKTVFHELLGSQLDTGAGCRLRRSPQTAAQFNCSTSEPVGKMTMILTCIMDHGHAMSCNDVPLE